ncbi:MAG: Mrp/NBP35 family ATP-binding protein [Rickettsiales bacterium]|nr:Mrp/NBP35 family ATP-binding protein [Rickettsiales bacterium]
MSRYSTDDVRSILSKVIDPLSGQDVISAGLISGIVIRDSRIGFQITIEPSKAALQTALQPACEAALLALDGIEHVTAVLTAQSAGDALPAAPSVPVASPRAPAQWNLSALDNVHRVIAVSSGKGGVGKSTLSCGLALALAQAGQKVGLLDLDLYGPSLPRMMGIHDKPQAREGKLVPPMIHGIQCLSMGMLMGNAAAVVRGPIITKTLQQMLRGSWWGTPKHALDTLIIDLPPGTGDIQLSLAQALPLAYNNGGALLVTTPQMVAIEDARKAAQMWRKVNVPILGVIENMSWFDDPSGERHRLFGEGGGKALAEEYAVSLLAQLPLMPALRAQADAGNIDASYFAALAEQFSLSPSRVSVGHE